MRLPSPSSRLTKAVGGLDAGFVDVHAFFQGRLVALGVELQRRRRDKTHAGGERLGGEHVRLLGERGGRFVLAGAAATEPASSVNSPPSARRRRKPERGIGKWGEGCRQASLGGGSGIAGGPVRLQSA